MVTILILGILAAIAVAIFFDQPGGYTVGVESRTGTTFTIERDDTVTVNLSCDRPDPGGCPAPDGNWG